VDAPERRKLRARHLVVEAALDMTKLSLKLRRACMLVLVHGYTNAEAAHKIGLPGNSGRQNVYRALKRLRPKLGEVEAHVKEIVRERDTKHE